MKIPIDKHLLKIVDYKMGREKRGGYLIEWWMGDHLPKHVHVYKKGKEVAKVQIPSFLVLKGAVSKKLQKILKELTREGKLK